METGQKHKTRNLPIQNWVDSNTRNMIINEIIFEEYIRSVLGKYRQWATKAQARLTEYGISLTETSIQSHYRDLKSGKKKPMAASSFSGKPFDNKLIARYGKDLVYSKFELMVDMFVDEGTNYVGLPASQILMAARNYDSVDACERSGDMMAFMFMLKRHFAPAASAVKFLESEQEKDGTWFGRWGVNYLYGTWCALCGLHAIGYDMQTPRIRRSVAWLRSCQNKDGGWGESCRSYDDPAQKGKGESSASQTAWALMALIAAGSDSAPVLKCD